MAMGKINISAAPGFHRLKMTRATTAPSTPNTKGSVVAACVCWACLKIGRESVC